MLIEFFVNGARVDSYRLSGYAAPPGPSDHMSLPANLSQEDKQAIDTMKRTAYRNFGYPPVVVVTAE